jgi:hypothetical protein
MVKALMHKMLETTSAAAPMPTISDLDQFFRNRIKDHQRETCSRTVFKVHRLVLTHLNIRHHPRHQDRPHLGLVHRCLRDFLLHLRTHQARLIMVPLAAVPSDHRLVMGRNSADLEVLDLLSVLNLDQADRITLGDLHSWDPQAHLSMDKFIQAWADQDT